MAADNTTTVERSFIHRLPADILAAAIYRAVRGGSPATTRRHSNEDQVDMPLFEGRAGRSAAYGTSESAAQTSTILTVFDLRCATGDGLRYDTLDRTSAQLSERPS